MRLHDLKAPKGSNTKPVRKGRGTATGQGKTAGRGQGGQNSRSGGGVRIGFEGGQMPMTRQLPKRGFSNYRYRKDIATISLDKLNGFENGSVITVEELKAKGLVKNRFDGVKVLLGNEKLNVAVTLRGIAASKGAAEAIAAAGGKVEE